MFMLIPVVILLTVSFFVLVTLNKVEAKGLKTFGWAICVLLWFAAALVLTTALTSIGVIPYGAGRMMFQCPITSSQRPLSYSQRDRSDFKRSGYHKWGSDPRHPWKNNPHKGLMMEETETQCPGMSEIESETSQTAAPQPVEKK